MVLPSLKFGPGTLLGALGARGYSFGYMQPHELPEVLGVRHAAYCRAGKLSADSTPENMRDPSGIPAMVLVARHRGRVVATASILLAAPGRPLNHEASYGIRFDSDYSRDEVVEVNKLAVLPNHWGTGVFQGLLSLIVLAVLSMGRRYVVFSAAGRLVKTYEQLGMKKSGLSYIHPKMKLQHHLMTMDVLKVARGEDVSPLVWNISGGWEVWRHVEGGARLAPLLLRLLWPVAYVAFYAKLRRLRGVRVTQRGRTSPGRAG